MLTAAELDGLWLFDGSCNFCSGSVRLILAADRRGALRFCTLQSPLGRALAQEAGLDPEAPNSFLFFDQGQPLQRSAAVIELLARLPPPWRWFSAVRLLPEAWRDRAYDWLAANRYRLMGRRQTCMVPTREVQARFLTGT